MYTILESGEYKFSGNLDSVAPYFKSIVASSRFTNLLKFS